MTQAQIQTKITKMRFTYLGKDEELVLKKVLSEINLATGVVVDRNIDGGFAAETYLSTQNYDGGGA